MGALSKKFGGDAMTNCHQKELERYTCTLISIGCGWWTLSINYFSTVYFTIACFDFYRTCMYRYSPCENFCQFCHAPAFIGENVIAVAGTAAEVDTLLYSHDFASYQ